MGQGGRFAVHSSWREKQSRLKAMLVDPTLAVVVLVCLHCCSCRFLCTAQITRYSSSCVHLKKAVVSESEGGKDTVVLRSRCGMYSYPCVVGV